MHSKPPSNALRPRAGLYRLTLALLCLAFAVMALLICAASGRNLVQTVGASALFYLLLPPALLALLLYLWRFVPQRGWFPLVLFLAALVLRGAVALLVDTQPESDFGLIYEAARQLAQGNNILNTSPYFLRWPYQSGFVALLAGCMKYLGAGLPFFKLMNALLSALTNCGVYLLARRFASERAAQVAAVLFLLYPGATLLIPVLTNQHLSEFLLLAALLVYTRPTQSLRAKLLQAGGAGALLALSNFVRPMAVVVLLAAAAWEVLLLTRLAGRAFYPPPAKALLAPCMLLLAYLFCWRGLDATVRLSGLNLLGLTNQVPQWKFILGLNQTTAGQYSYEDAALVFSADGSTNWEAVSALMAQRTAITPGQLLRLLLRKIAAMWGQFEDSSWAFTQQVMAGLEARGLAGAVSRLTRQLRRLGGGSYALLGLLTAGGALGRLRKSDPLPEGQALVMLSALAYFCAHLFIEIQPRYRSTMTLFLFVLAAPGLDALTTLLARRQRTNGDKPPQP